MGTGVVTVAADVDLFIEFSAQPDNKEGRENIHPMKNTIKHITLIILAALIGFSCAACSGSTDPKSEATTKKDTAAEETVRIFISDDEKYGLKRGNKPLTDQIWDYISAAGLDDYGLYIAELNGKYGVLNNKGEIVQEPKWTKLECVQSSPLLYLASLNNQYFLLNAEFETAKTFSWTKAHGAGILGIQSDIIMASDKTYATIVYSIKRDKVIYTNKDAYVHNESFSNGLTVLVKERGVMGDGFPVLVINADKGEVVAKFNVDNWITGLKVHAAGNGVLFHYEMGDKYQETYFSNDGKIKVSATNNTKTYRQLICYQNTLLQEREVFSVYDSVEYNKYGTPYRAYNTVNNTIVSECIYLPYELSRKIQTNWNIAGQADATGHNWVLLNLNDCKIIKLPDVYDMKEYSFNDKLAAVQNKEGKWGYADTSGKIVIDFQFDGADTFSGGQASVIKDYKKRTIDTNGKFIQ